jgi:hypothetical protein
MYDTGKLIDWLGDYAKRVRKLEDDLPEAESWDLLILLDKMGLVHKNLCQDYLPTKFTKGDLLDRTAILIRRIDKEDGFIRVESIIPPELKIKSKNL